MDIFSMLDQNFGETFQKMLEESEKQEQLYLSMSKEELQKLDDYELYKAITVRIQHEAYNTKTAVCAEGLEGTKRNFYVLNEFHGEILEGGLCQYFTNIGNESAPYLMTALESAQADTYAKKLTDFLVNNNLSLDSLEEFAIDVDVYIEKSEIYPFEEFDDFYSEFDFEKILTAYCRKHLDELV